MLLNLAQTAEKLGITPESVKRLVEGGALPRVPYGNADSNKRPTYRFNEADVLNFRRARTAANTAAANGSANGTSTTAATTILGDDCVTLADAANVLGWKRQRVYDQIKAGNLTGRIVGRHMMLPRTELERAKALPKAGLRRPRRRDCTLSTATTGHDAIYDHVARILQRARATRRHRAESRSPQGRDRHVGQGVVLKTRPDDNGLVRTTPHEVKRCFRPSGIGRVTRTKG
jgi:hypothetical protein